MQVNTTHLQHNKIQILTILQHSIWQSEFKKNPGQNKVWIEHTTFNFQVRWPPHVVRLNDSLTWLITRTRLVWGSRSESWLIMRTRLVWGSRSESWLITRTALVWGSRSESWLIMRTRLVWGSRSESWLITRTALVWGSRSEFLSSFLFQRTLTDEPDRRWPQGVEMER